MVTVAVSIHMLFYSVNTLIQYIATDPKILAYLPLFMQSFALQLESNSDMCLLIQVDEREYWAIFYFTSHFKN